MSGSAIFCFTLSRKWHDFREGGGDIEHKMSFFFLYNFCLKYFVLSSIEWDIIVNIQGGSNMTGTNCDLFTHKSSRSYLNHLVHRSLCEVPITRIRFQSNVNFLDRSSTNTWTLNIMKIHPVGAELFYADGQTDVTKFIVVFCNFAKAPKIIYCCLLVVKLMQCTSCK